MTLGFLFSAVRRYWYVVMGGVMIGALASIFLGSSMPKKYEASSLVLLSAPKVGNPTDSSVYVRERMATYAELIESEPVLEYARALMGTDASTAFLADNLAPRVEVSTVLITIRASWASPGGAADLANAVARSYAEVAPNVDNKDDPYLRVNIIETATAPTRDAGLSVTALFLIGSVFGLATGLIAAILLRHYRPYARTVGDISDAANAEVIALVELPRGAEAPGDRSARRSSQRRRGDIRASFDDVYFHAAFAGDGPHPQIVVVVSTVDGAHAAEVAWGLAVTSVASGQRCLLVAVDEAARNVLDSHGAVPLQSRGIEGRPQLIGTAAFAASEGGIVSVRDAKTVLHSVGYPGDLIVIAAPPPETDTNTRAFAKVAGSALIATPLSGSRTALVRRAVLGVRNTGTSVIGVVATMPGEPARHALMPEHMEPASTGVRS